MSAETYLEPLSKISLRSRNSKASFATTIYSKLNVLCASNAVPVVKKQMKILSEIYPE